jgi:hypothetical protein
MGVRTLVTGLGLAALIGLTPSAKADETADLFLFLTAADAQTQGMALVLATQAVEQGHAARILLCGPAGDLALVDGRSPTLAPRDVTPQQMLQHLIGRGVPVQVCALYLPNAGKTAADLLEGVSPAQPPAIAELMMRRETRLFTF